MEISIDSFIALVISSFGILFSLLIGVQLLAKKSGSSQANIFLGLLLILYSLNLLNSLMAMTGLYAKYQFLYFLPLSFSFSIGPLFYLFVKARVQPTWRFKKNDWIHLCLPAVQFLFYASIGFRSTAFKSWVWRTIIAPYGQYIEEMALITISTAYIIAAIKLINTTAAQELWKDPILKWLRKFSFALISLLAFSSIYEITDWFLWGLFEFNLLNTPWLDFPLKLSYGLISLVIGYNAYLYQHQALIIPKRTIVYEDSSLDEQVSDLLEKKKVFLDPELSADMLAKMLGIHRNELSKYFATKNSSFRAAINELRIDYFLQLIEEGKEKNYTILAMAFEAGFNSKASFNRVFKASKGQTPLEYIQAKS